MDEGNEFPLFQILLNSLRLLVEHSGAALRIAVLPFLLMLGISRLTAYVWPQGFEEIGWEFLMTAVATLPLTMLLVPWYRLILSRDRPELAEGAAQNWYVLFLIRTLLLELLLLAFLAPPRILRILAEAQGGDDQLQKMAFFMFFGLLALGFYLYARLALALPAAAAGDAGGFRQFWAATATVGWRLAAIIFAIVVGIDTIHYLLLGPGSPDSPRVPWTFAESILHAAIAVLNELIIAAALAQSYRFLERGQQR